MSKTRTPGITVRDDGQRILDKEYRGVRIYVRLGQVSQLEAEQRLHAEIERAEREHAQAIEHVPPESPGPGPASS